MSDKMAIWKSLLMFLLVIVIIAGVAYILFPSTFESKLSNRKANNIVYATPPHVQISADLTDTTGWKTYSNSKYGYTFQYPSALDISATDDIQDVVANQSNGIDGSISAIKVHVTINQPVYEFNNMYAVSENSVVKKTGTINIIKVKNITIDNAKAVSYKYETILSDSGIQKVTTYGTLINNGNIIIDISSWGEDDKMYIALLPTLRLTK